MTTHPTASDAGARATGHATAQATEQATGQAAVQATEQATVQATVQVSGQATASTVPAPQGSRWTVVDSAVGPLRLVADDAGLAAIQFTPLGDAEVGARRDDDPLLREASRQLASYFAGELREFDLPLAPRGTDYQLRVWQALRQVPYGRTATYAEIAAALGQPPGASRAVGLANGRNPIPIVVPCHRVIGSDGSLTGYAGGLERKQLLLDLERGEEERLF